MNQHHSTTIIIISFKNDFNKILKKINTTKKNTIANVFTNHSSKKNNSMNILFSVKNNKISRKGKLTVKI